VVQRDVIDLGVVLEELPHTVHVVSLGCHVDGGQAILEQREGGCKTGKDMKGKQREEPCKTFERRKHL
jgi:hypothetical protein